MKLQYSNTWFKKNIYLKCENCIQRRKIINMTQVWSVLLKMRLIYHTTVFDLIFPFYVWALYSNIFVTWPHAAILLHNRWFIQQFAQVSLGVPLVSCQHYQHPLLILSLCLVKMEIKISAALTPGYTKHGLTGSICCIWIESGCMSLQFIFAQTADLFPETVICKSPDIISMSTHWRPASFPCLATVWVSVTGSLQQTVLGSSPHYGFSLCQGTPCFFCFHGLVRLNTMGMCIKIEPGCLSWMGAVF